MKKNLNKLTVLFLVLGAVLCSLLFISSIKTETFMQPKIEKNYVPISEPIAYTNLTSGESGTYTVGDSLDSDDGDVINFTFEVDSYDDAYLSLYTSYLGVEVLIDGESVYSYGNDDSIPSYMTAPPSKWHQIPLESNGTMQIEILITDLNARSDVKIQSLGVGTDSGIYATLMAIELPDLLMSLVFVAIAFVLFCIFIYSFIRKAPDKNTGLICLFTFNIGIYFVTVSPLFEAIANMPSVIYLINYIALIFLPVTFTLLCLGTVNLERNKFKLNLLLLIGILLFFVSTFLQLAGIRAYYESLFFFYFFDIVTITVCCMTLANERKNNNGQRAYRLLASARLFGIFIVIQMILFAMAQSATSLKILKLGFIIFLLILSLDSFYQFKDTLALREKAARLSKIAYVDPLTYFGNRTAFEEELTQIRNHVGQKVSVINFDMNNLKTINDTLGHKVGDQALIEVSHMISEKLPDATKFRIGGDEFIALSYNIDEVGIQSIVEDINLSKRSLKLHTGDEITVSLSSGYNFFTFEENEDVEAVLEAADRMMYENKMLSRNCRNC